MSRRSKRDKNWGSCKGATCSAWGKCDLRCTRPSAGSRPIETYPAVIFDGYAVYQSLSEKAKTRTSPENVADVLDAVAELIRQDLKK